MKNTINYNGKSFTLREINLPQKNRFMNINKNINLQIGLKKNVS